MITILIEVFFKLNSWLLGAFARLMQGIANHGIMTKTVMTTLAITTLPTVIRNAAFWIEKNAYEGSVEGMSGLFSMLNVTSNSIPSSMSFTGFAGYMAMQLGLDHCVSIVITAALIRFIISVIGKMAGNFLITGIG
jgi:hypothetical protein